MVYFVVASTPVRAQLVPEPEVIQAKVLYLYKSLKAVGKVA
jgi:hypothetical protein